MKKTLIAMMLSTTLMGGLGATLVGEKTEAAVLNSNKANSNLLLTNTVNDMDILSLKSNCGVYQRRIVFNKYFGCLNGHAIYISRPSFSWGNITGSNNNTDDSNDETITDDNVGNNEGSNDENNNGIGNNGEVVTPPVNEDSPSIDETPSVDETPNVNETPSIDESPSIDNSINSNVSSDKFMAEVESLIYQKVNEERAKAGLTSLSYNTTMEKYARIKSQDMGDNNYFSHEDLSGNLITTNMKNDGVTYNAWGENIAYIGGVSDANALAEQFMTNWMNSSGHRANILSTNFSSIGVGVYQVGNRVYATQEFYR